MLRRLWRSGCPGPERLPWAAGPGHTPAAGGGRSGARPRLDLAGPAGLAGGGGRRRRAGSKKSEAVSEGLSREGRGRSRRRSSSSRSRRRRRRWWMRKWRRWRSAIAPASAARVWPARCVLIIYVYYDVFRDTLTDRLNTRPHTAIIPRSPRLETNETTAASNPTARSWPPAAHLASSAVDDAPGQRDSIHCPTDGTVERFTADAVHSGTLLAKPRCCAAPPALICQTKS